MGPCTSIQYDGCRTKLPLCYSVPCSNQKVFNSGLNEFELELSNVSVTHTPTSEAELSFEIVDIPRVGMLKSNRITQRLEVQQPPSAKSFETKWQQCNKLQLSLSDAQLAQTFLSVYLSQDDNAPIEVIRISLYLIVNGPYHHNIQIPFNHHPRRIIFDAKVSHLFEIKTRVERLQINLNRTQPLNGPSFHPLNLCHFTVKAIRQEEVIADSSQSYSIQPQILPKKQLSQQDYFQEQRPNISKIKTIQTFPEEEEKSTILTWSGQTSPFRQHNTNSLINYLTPNTHKNHSNPNTSSPPKPNTYSPVNSYSPLNSHSPNSQNNLNNPNNTGSSFNSNSPNSQKNLNSPDNPPNSPNSPEKQHSPCKQSSPINRQEVVSEGMPEVSFDSSTLQIASYSIQIGIWSEIQRTAEYVCEANVPLWKLLDREYIKSRRNKQDALGNMVSLQHRVLTITERLYCHQDVVGTCDIQLHIYNQKLIEQSKYSSRTEEGVVNLRPSTFSKTIKSNSKNIHQIWKLSDQIDKTVKEEAANSSIAEVEVKIQNILKEIYDLLKNTLNQVLYSDGSNSEALLNNQQIFISLMAKLSPFTEDAENSSLSEISWAIIIGFLKRREFSIENLGLKGTNKSLESESILRKKKEVGLKYQEVLYKLITNALKCYGLYSSNNNMLSHFLSFCYFRVPTFRDYFLEVMDFQNNYAEMESRLIVFQREIEPKSSFGSSFADIKGDWKCNFYDQLQQLPKSKQLALDLQSSFKSKKFFIQLSYKDQTLQNFFSLLFRCLSNDSSQKSDKWKYIEGYSKVVAIILTELKQKEVTKYRPSLVKLSIELLQNEHLIGPMLPLICDKTNIHEVEKVQIVLDLMEEYLQAATKKKEQQIPSTCNSNYLLKVVRAILQGESCYAINRFLVIIYHFFDQLGIGFKLQLAMYLTGKVFFKLFYHWSSEVRYTFYLILIVKVQHICHPRNTEIIAHFTKILSISKILERLYGRNNKNKQLANQKTLYKKMKLKVQEKFKQKNSLEGSSQHRRHYSLENIYKMLDEENILPLFHSADSFKNKPFELPSFDSKYLENEQFDLQMPGKRERSYSDKVAVAEQFLNKRNPSSGQTEAEGKKQFRKKRRPSLFLDNFVSPNPKSQPIPKISTELQELSELKQEEIRNIGIATAHFNEVSQQIVKYALKNGGAMPSSDYIDIKKTMPTA